MKIPASPTCFIIPMLIDVCAGLVLLAAPVLLKTEYHLSEDLVGLILGGATILYVVFTLLTGRISDRTGPIFTITIGLWLITFISLGAFLWTALPIFIICTLLAQFGHAFFWPSFQAWIGKDVDRYEMARRVGIFAVGWSFGLSAIGPYIGGFLMEEHPRWPFLGSALIAVIVVLFYHLFKPQLKKFSVTDHHEADYLIPSDIRSKFLFAARCSNLAGVLSMVTLRIYFPLLGIDWALSTTQIGQIMFILGMSQSLTFLVLSLTHHWHYRASWLIVIQLLGSLGLLSFGILPIVLTKTMNLPMNYWGVWISIPCLILTGMTSGISFFSSSFYSLFGQQEKGKNAGINESLVGLAGIIGTWGGGFAIRFFGTYAPYTLGGLLVLGLTLCQVFYLRHHGIRIFESNTK